mgnify:CR=1 FL=1
MVQLFTWAYQDWHSITIDKLREVVGPAGITEEDFKTITGEDFTTDTATTSEVKSDAS